MEHRQHIPNLSQSEAREATGAFSLDSLPVVLGFVESEEMKQLSLLMVDSLVNDSVDVKPLIAQYRTLGEQQAETLHGEEFPRSQIGLLVKLSLIKRDLGRTEDYIEDLEDALEYAENMGYENVVDSIEQALDQIVESLKSPEILQTSDAIASVLSELGEEVGFDGQTCLEIAGLPFEVAFVTAYGYLLQAGGDPDKVLAPFIDGVRGG